MTLPISDDPYERYPLILIVRCFFFFVARRDLFFFSSAIFMMMAIQCSGSILVPKV